MNRSEFREDITGSKKSIEKTWNEKYKSRNDLYWRYHRNRRLEELYNSELLKKIHVFLKRSYQITTVKKLQNKKRNNAKGKRYVPNYNYKRLNMRENKNI